jgi:hypothetical protein
LKEIVVGKTFSTRGSIFWWFLVSLVFFSFFFFFSLSFSNAKFLSFSFKNVNSSPSGPTLVYLPFAERSRLPFDQDSGFRPLSGRFAGHAVGAQVDPEAIRKLRRQDPHQFLVSDSQRNE